MTLRQRVTATVGASLGLSAIAGLMLAGWQTWDAHLKQGIEQQKLVTDAARDLGKAIGENPAFDAATDAAVQLFRSQAGAPPYPESIQLMVGSLAESLQAKCASLPPGKLATACNNDLTILGAVPALTRWDRAMVGYRDWPPKVALEPGAAMAATAAPTTPMTSAVAAAGAAHVAESAPPPPPPPPPAVAAATPAGTTVVTTSGQQPPAGNALADAARTACTQGITRRFIVYTEIYDEAERAGAEALLPKLRDLGVATPGIENVTTTAASQGRTLPFQWHAPTLLYSNAGAACASAISAWLDAIRPFPSARAPQAVPFPLSIRGEPNVIELWLPTTKAAPKRR
jgi:hypothetical protein